MVSTKKELECITIEKQENIGWIILNLPEKRNIFTPEMSRDMIAAFQDVVADDAIDVIITTGNGTAYTAGNQGQKMINAHDARMRGEVRRGMQMGTIGGMWGLSDTEVVRTCPKVTIAAVNGYCLGHGLHFYLQHDLGIASEEKAQFGLPEIMRSMTAGPLPASTIMNMPFKWAMDMILTGENWDARTAQMVGIVSRIVPHDKLKESAFQWAKEIAQWDKGALTYIKRKYRAILEPHYFEALQANNLAGEAYSWSSDEFSMFRDFLSKKGVKANRLIKWVKPGGKLG